MRHIFSLGSAASDVYDSSRDDSDLKLVRTSPTGPVREFTFRDAAAGVKPASEADDATAYIGPANNAPDSSGPGFVATLQDWWAQIPDLSSKTDSVVYAAEMASPEPVLRAGSIAASIAGGGAIALGYYKVGAGLLGLVMTDLALRHFVPSYRALRLNDPRVW